MGVYGKYGRLRGDPGFFGGLGKIAKGAMGLVTKTPVGRIASKFVPGLNIASLGMTAFQLGKAGGKFGRSVSMGIQNRLLPGRAGGFGMTTLGKGASAASGITPGKLALAAGGGAGVAAGGGGLYGLYKQQLEAQGVAPSVAAAHARAATGHKRRRMNPGNARAARRAIRRIKSVRKLLHSIESQLPKRRTSAAPTYAFHRRARRRRAA